MKKLKYLFLIIAVLCVTCMLSVTVSAAKTYTDVGAVEITLPALVDGRSRTIPKEYVDVKLYSDADKTKVLDSSLYEITSLTLSNSDYPQDTLVAGKEYDLTIVIEAPSGKPMLRDPVNPNGFYDKGVKTHTKLHTNASYAGLVSLIRETDGELIITVSVWPSSTTKLVSSLNAKYLGFPTYQGKPDYTMTLSTEGVEMYTENDSDLRIKNGIMWWYTPPAGSYSNIYVHETNQFAYERNPMVRLYIKAKEGYVLDYPSVLKNKTIIYLGNDYVSTSRTSLVKEIGEISGYSLEEAMYIDLEVPLEQVTLKVVNGYMYSGDELKEVITNGTKRIAGTTLTLLPGDIPMGKYFSGWTSSPAVTMVDTGTLSYPNKKYAEVRGNGNGNGTQTFTANFASVGKKMSVYTNKWTEYSTTSVTGLPAYENCSVRYMLSISKAQYDKGYRLEITGYEEEYRWNSTNAVNYGKVTYFSSSNGLTMVDNGDGTVYLQDNTVSGDKVLTGKGTIYYQLLSPSGKVVWTDTQTFTMEFARSEPLAEGLKFVMDGETYDLTAHTGYGSAAAAYLNHDLDFYWTQPASVSVAGASAKLYARAYLVVNGEEQGLIPLTESSRTYDSTLGYYKISTAELPAARPEDNIGIRFQIWCEHKFPSGTTAFWVNDENYILYYTAWEPNGNEPIFKSYTIGDEKPVTSPQKSYTANVTAAPFVEFPVTITTQKIKVPQGSSLSVSAKVEHSTDKGTITMDLTGSGVDSADGRTTSYIIDRYSYYEDALFSGLQGEKFTITLSLSIKTASNQSIKLGTAVLNISFGEYDTFWKGKLIQTLRIDGQAQSGFLTDFDIYKDYSIGWDWKEPAGLAKRFVAEPLLELFREYDWENGDDPSTYVEADDLKTFTTGSNTYCTYETVSGNLQDMGFSKKTTLVIRIRDTQTGEKYMIDSKTAIYCFNPTFTKSVRVNGKDIGVGNSLPDQTVSPGTNTLAVDWSIPDGLVKDGYYIGVKYLISDEDDNTIITGEYLPASIKTNDVNTFEITLNTADGMEYDIALDPWLVNKTTFEWLWFLESNEFTLIGSKDAGGYTVSGSLKTFGSDTDPVTITLIPDDQTKETRSITVSGSAESYSIPNVAPGSYTLTVSKKNHVTREYRVSVIQ